MSRFRIFPDPASTLRGKAYPHAGDAEAAGDEQSELATSSFEVGFL